MNSVGLPTHPHPSEFMHFNMSQDPSWKIQIHQSKVTIYFKKVKEAFTNLPAGVIPPPQPSMQHRVCHSDTICQVMALCLTFNNLSKIFRLICLDNG